MVKNFARTPIRFARGDNGSVRLGHEKVAPLLVIKHTPQLFNAMVDALTGETKEEPAAEAKSEPAAAKEAVAEAAAE